jgi:hypothetical protein
MFKPYLSMSPVGHIRRKYPDQVIAKKVPAIPFKCPFFIFDKLEEPVFSDLVQHMVWEVTRHTPWI